eukprot:COSAG01_NODE_24586_length_773_cov_35.455490_1_plen_97_part_00
MTLYHCRPTAFTTALDIYLATSSPSLVPSPFECACVGSYAASCTSGADTGTGPPAAQRIKSGLGNATVAVIEDASDWPFAQNSNACFRAVDDFLAT